MNTGMYGRTGIKQRESLGEVRARLLGFDDRAIAGAWKVRGRDKAPRLRVHARFKVFRRGNESKIVRAGVAQRRGPGDLTVAVAPHAEAKARGKLLYRGLAAPDGSVWGFAGGDPCRVYRQQGASMVVVPTPEPLVETWETGFVAT